MFLSNSLHIVSLHPAENESKTTYGSIVLTYIVVSEKLYTRLAVGIQTRMETLKHGQKKKKKRGKKEERKKERCYPISTSRKKKLCVINISKIYLEI